MTDIDKQVQYWKTSAMEDYGAAKDLLEKGRTRHALFFAHLSLEKILKAHFCLANRQVAPKSHDLLRLAHLAGLKITQAQEEFLSEFGRFQLEGRYPEMLEDPPSGKEAKIEMAKAEELHSWLMQKL